MAPPLYIDLGKTARDVFFKGYNFGFIKSETTTKSGAIEFKTNVAQNTATNKLSGSVDIKYKIPEHGATISERWNTDNVLTTEVVIDDKVLKGLKLILDSTYAPFVGKRTAKAKCEFRHDSATVNGELKLDGAGGPIFLGSAVLGFRDWLIGYQTGYDTSKGALTQNNVSLATDVNGFSFHSYVQDAREYGGSVCHRVHSGLDLAANMSWVAGEQATRFGLALRYDLDRDTVLRAKVGNASQLALALTHTLKPGFKVTGSAAFNVQNVNDGSHKLGLGFEYAP